MRRVAAAGCGLTLLCLAHAPLPGQHAVGPTESKVPLIEALVSEDLGRAHRLMESEPSQLNALDVITPLYAAQEYVRSSKQRHETLRRLLKAGALPDQPTNDGSTPLMLAAYHGDVRSAQILLEHGADPLRKNGQGHHAISAAQNGRHAELAECAPTPSKARRGRSECRAPPNNDARHVLAVRLGRMLREHVGESGLRRLATDEGLKVEL